MSPRLRPEPFSADHERARTLAAMRLDGQLAAGEAGWLADHLAWCGPCRAVATEYDEQRMSLRALRHDQPQPPRDLWARTAATIEADGRHRRGPRPARPVGLRGFAPLAGVLVVVIAVGAGLLNGSSLFPSFGSTTKGTDVVATPIALAGGEIQVLSPGTDGSLEILSANLDHVCPVAADTCGPSTPLDATKVSNLGAGSDVEAIISPDREQMVVVDYGAGGHGVFVVPVKPGTTIADTSAPPASGPTTTAATTDSPRPTASTGPDASAAVATTPEPTDEAASAEATEPPSVGPDESPTGGAAPTATPDGSTDTSAAPDATPTPEPSGTPDETPATSPEATPTPAATDRPATPRPAGPTPSIAVTPGPDGTIEIARDVTVVGSVASYSADGTRFAFSARAADDSAGPDVYVWRVGEREAHAITTDHGSLFSGWLGAKPLVSRVVDGSPRTFVVDLGTGNQRLAHDDAMWRPTIGPGRRTATWWDGSVRRSADGTSWLPDKGRLILGAWPGGRADAQVLADGPISDWDVRWDESGTMLAVWVAGNGPRHAGKLSLYAIDPATGRADLAAPKLDAVPAFAGFSLKPGRLAWSAPQAGGDTSVEVLAWSGDTIVGRLSLPTESGATVVR